MSLQTDTNPEPEAVDTSQPSGRSRLNTVLLVLAVAVIAVTLALPHGDVPHRLDYLGRAVCGQLPEHSLYCGEQQLPHCARCTGTYLGALVAYVVLSIMGRGRANALPPVQILLLLGLFIALWALDGANSYLTLYSQKPLLYEPNNLFRLVSGLLQGMALMVILRPIVSATLWADSQNEPVVRGYRDLFWLLLALAAVGYVAWTGMPWLYVPLAVPSVAGQLLMLTLVNSLVICLLLRREALATSWRQTAVLWTLGLAAALVEISLINLGRDALSRLFGLPL